MRLHRLGQIMRQEGPHGFYSRLRYPKRRRQAGSVAPFSRQLAIIGARSDFTDSLSAALIALGHQVLPETARPGMTRLHIDPENPALAAYGPEDVLVVTAASRLDPARLGLLARHCHSIIETSETRLARLIEAGAPAGRLFLIAGDPALLRRDLYRIQLAVGSVDPDQADWQQFHELQELGRRPRLCLSLPETPERRHSFLRRRLPEFRLFNGVRGNPGWIGAAIGFRLMARACLSARVDSAVICEDDLYADPRFEDRLEVVTDYLAQTEWDVFSGLSTHVGDGYRVTRVERFRGETFVHLNRTTGMVFNIFAPRALDWLAAWSVGSHARARITIDRHLEKMPAMRVVTTLPFLVDHADGLASSAWGFSNRRYRGLISASQRRLARMVAEFEASEGGRRHPPAAPVPRGRAWWPSL